MCADSLFILFFVFQEGTGCQEAKALDECVQNVSESLHNLLILRKDDDLVRSAVVTLFREHGTSQTKSAIQVCLSCAYRVPV